MLKAVFSTAYLPSIAYISELVKFPSVEIEQYENFRKQTIRNRCHILSANGILTLRIPVKHEQKKKILIKDLKISYDGPWQRIHWGAMQSAYNKSPFFEFYKDDFEKIMFSNKTFLLDFNTELLQIILKIIGIKTKISFTHDFEKNYPENDFRILSNAKTTSNSSLKRIRPLMDKLQTANQYYTQVFSYKSDFTSNLSIVDLIFNQGKASINFLRTDS